jgi:four helix bundle protein
MDIFGGMAPMSPLKTYRDLEVWQEAMNLVEIVFQLTDRFPASETYLLTNQLRRAVVSIPANIAEGRGRGTRKDFRHFLFIAKGSLAESETLLLIAQRAGRLTRDELIPAWKQCQSVGRLLNAMIRSLSAPVQPMKAESQKPKASAKVSTSAP